MCNYRYLVYVDSLPSSKIYSIVLYDLNTFKRKHLYTIPKIAKLISSKDLLAMVYGSEIHIIDIFNPKDPYPHFTCNDEIICAIALDYFKFGILTKYGVHVWELSANRAVNYRLLDQYLGVFTNLVRLTSEYMLLQSPTFCEIMEICSGNLIRKIEFEKRILWIHQLSNYELAISLEDGEIQLWS